ncbi:hypothetical protein JJB07_20290 [Tumebacillus sp. ITR2]|uniref:DUF2802 domain-containing protein n=1 Tax=Tumebacillus amylolyticus TaxID=2801339 RepID=A0ABS1JFE0_9BACL|nr:hypothetical protein [Tumebacillus amylolyticus]MBL0388940.1 hypothetical protein [Tumebacillus amylolyticus]
MNQLYLYVALVGVVIVLFALTRAKSTSAGSSVVPAATLPSSAVDQELKNTFDEFMNELERENGRILDSFSNLERETREQLAAQQNVIQALDQRVQELEQLVASQALVPALAAAATTDSAVVPGTEPQAAEQPKVPGFLVNEKYTKVVELANRGLAEPQIARETGIGIGEIRLVLGLVKREEER